VRDELESLFSTVLYFDQHPDEFERAAAGTPPEGRWLPTPPVAAVARTRMAAMTHADDVRPRTARTP